VTTPMVAMNVNTTISKRFTGKRIICPIIPTSIMTSNENVLKMTLLSNASFQISVINKSSRKDGSFMYSGLEHSGEKVSSGFKFLFCLNFCVFFCFSTFSVFLFCVPFVFSLETELGLLLVLSFLTTSCFAILTSISSSWFSSTSCSASEPSHSSSTY